MKLNLGSGYDTLAGWVHVDKLDYGSNTVADVLKGLPFEDNTFDLVLMNHTLQMFHYDELPVALKEVRRVMKIGGTLRILSPDLKKAIEAYEAKNHDYFPISDELEYSIAGKFARYIFWHGDTRCAFTNSSLRELLMVNDFVHIKKGKFGDCELDSRESESLILEATK